MQSNIQLSSPLLGADANKPFPVTELSSPPSFSLRVEVVAAAVEEYDEPTNKLFHGIDTLIESMVPECTFHCILTPPLEESFEGGALLPLRKCSNASGRNSTLFNWTFPDQIPTLSCACELLLLFV